MLKPISDKLSPKHYLVNILLMACAVFALYLLVAWSSYSPWDNSWSTSSSLPQVKNKAGILGAWIIDLLFVLFGYISNFIPFSLLILSLYFLFKKNRRITCWHLALKAFGFMIFLAGCCVLFSMLITNDPYYPAGGVVGAILVKLFFPVLDFVGLMLSSVVVAIAGFLLFVGTGFIHLMQDLFYWLTMKSQQETTEVAQTSMPEQQSFELNVENINDPLQKNIDNLESKEFENEVDSSPKKELVDIGNFINIKGLEPETSSISTTSPSINIGIDAMPEQLASTTQMKATYEVEEALPTVNLTIPAQSAAQSSDITLMPVNEISRNADNAEHIEVMNSQILEVSAVSLVTSHQEGENLDNVTQSENIDVSTKHEEASAVSSLENQPVYKSYGKTLIHPALQPKAKNTEKPTTPFPSLDLLELRPVQANRITREEIAETSQRIEQQLRNFNVKAEVKDVLVGPVVTRYELELQPGVKASRVTSIDTDLARALMFRSIRVAEVIPGKPYIGIETPNTHRQIVSLREVLDSDEFRQSKALLPMALGKGISGKPIVVDLAKMPHLLVAGSTGSGKSVGINTMILSLLFHVKPEDVKFIMIDPKVVELSIYDGIPHLLTNVVTDMKKAANALRWCVDEMERRYQLLSALRVRNIEGYNEKIAEYEAINMPIPNPLWKPGDTMDMLPPPLEKLNYIVVIVDEFADLMMVAGKQVEELIARLAQKARAIGIHLILATQRPSVDVITGLIKANVPSRIAFTVASKIDSRTILDQGGAEALLGRGDMLYSAQGSTELMRVHGAFMSDDEVARVVDDWKARGKPTYIEGILESKDESDDDSDVVSSDELDSLFDEVANFVISTGNTSTSYVQRKFKVGFNRAARIMDQLEEQGIVSAQQNGKRELLARRSSDY